MTGYAAATEDAAGGALQLELRAVNSRFLDLQFRISDELRALEPMLREMIVARVSRGKVDCRFNWNAAGNAAQPRRLDGDALARLKALAREAAKAFPKAPPLRIADVLRWPGVAAVPTLGEEELRASAGRLCRQAVEDLVATRGREGAKLALAVKEKLTTMRRCVEAIKPLLPAAMAAYQQKIAERLREALGGADDERVRAEVALFVAKSDIDEELTRLHAHLDEVERVLDDGGARSSPVGKRLDFIAQELNREANTLASKAASAKISDCALQLKVLVEQIREQVQNIE